MTREQMDGLKRFGLFLAREFSGAKAGEWRCPMIGAEAAADVVEAIAALSAPAPSAVQELTELRKWMTTPYAPNSLSNVIAKIDARLSRLAHQQPSGEAAKVETPIQKPSGAYCCSTPCVCGKGCGSGDDKASTEGYCSHCGAIALAGADYCESHIPAPPPNLKRPARGAADAVIESASESTGT